MNRRFKIDTKNLFLTYPQNDTTPEVAMDRLKEHYKDDLNCAIVAQEKHKDGHNHLHIYCKLNNRFTTTKNTYFNFIADKQGNYQSCKKPIDVIQYVSKAGEYITYNIDPTKYIKQSKSHTTVQSKGIFKQITDEITKDTDYRDILDKYPDICLQHGKKIKDYINDVKTAQKPKYRDWQMEVEYHYGETGTGKSRYAFKDYNPETHYVLRKANGDAVWWDGYTGQETIIIDDFTPKAYKLSYMLNLLDRYAMTIDIKGGSTQLLAKKVIITSNYQPEDLYTGELCKEHRKALLRRFTKIVPYIKENTEQSLSTEDTETIDHTDNDIIEDESGIHFEVDVPNDNEIIALPIKQPKHKTETTDNYIKRTTIGLPLDDETIQEQYPQAPIYAKYLMQQPRYTYNRFTTKYWDRYEQEWIQNIP